MVEQIIQKRYELKFLLDDQQCNRLLDLLREYLSPDQYNYSEIRNIYFDTDTYRLIRHSIEKPVFKEKLRIRSYQPANADDIVFLELKKKYQGIVYKNRIQLPYQQALSCMEGACPFPVNNQASREIEYMIKYYQTLHPVILLCFNRTAFHDASSGSFRITFDKNIRFREDNITLSGDTIGTALLESGQTLVEIKTADSIPIWLAHFFSKEHIYITSFSKYGSAYKKIMQTKQGVRENA